MHKPQKKSKVLLWVLVTMLLGVGLFAIACQPSASESAPSSGGVTELDDAIPMPSANGIITADQWKDIHPDVYASFMRYKENGPEGRVNYLEQDPYIKTLYSGGGFAIHYEEAIGHPYSLTDVSNTQRSHTLANCLTCKSPEFIAMTVAEGDGVYAVEFDEIFEKIGEPISCWNCHANESDGSLVVSAGYLAVGLGPDIARVALEDQVCGQCHNEYHFDPDTKAAVLPYTSVAEMHPDAILAYYNATGFTDFTNAASGADMIKIQHPEMEYVLGEGSKVMGMGGFNCASCHMTPTKNENGELYTSHFLGSPLENQELIDSKCKTCHEDIAAQAKAIQAEITAREEVIGLKLEQLHNKIGEAAENGSKSGRELADLRSQVRDAQFYWDFSYVENSEGAHNSALARYVLDKAEALVDAALAGF